MGLLKLKFPLLYLNHAFIIIMYELSIIFKLQLLFFNGDCALQKVPEKNMVQIGRDEFFSFLRPL